MFCPNQKILTIHNGKRHIEDMTPDGLKTFLENTKASKNLVLDKRLYLIPCGKCSVCLKSKQNLESKKIQAALKQYKFNYLITLTFDNETIDLLGNRDELEGLEFSKKSTLNKLTISNIIKNWKNKLNRYYQKKVKLSYFLAAEYGGQTSRAHYHIILMLNDPLPKLEKQAVKGNHFKTDFLKSKQYNHYDIEVITNDNKATSKYLTKYLTKAQFNDRYTNLTRYHNTYLKWLSSIADIDYQQPLFIPNSKEDFWNLLMWFFQSKDINVLDYPIKFKEIKRQKEFIKKSRGLGLSFDQKTNINNGLFNYYYRKKNKDIEVFQYYNERRIRNILKYLTAPKSTLKPDKFKRNDVF